MSKHFDITYTQNRELSWLKFNERVLEEGKDKDVPLFERLKFLSIFTSNLDEFYMIRVGSLYDVAIMDTDYVDNKSNLNAKEQLKAIFRASVPLYNQRDTIFQNIEDELRKKEIKNLNIKDLGKEEKEFLENYFKDYIIPVLSPQIIDNLHPFPHLQNLSLNMAVLIQNGNENLMGIVPIPSSIPRVIYIPGKEVGYVLVEKLILQYANLIFNTDQIMDKAIVRVTRNADITLNDVSYDLDYDYKLRMKKILKKRSRLAPVRLEIFGKTKTDIQMYLMDKLNLKKDQVFKSKSPLDMSYVFKILNKIHEETKREITYKDFSPQNPYGIMKHESMINKVLKEDVLLSYPYEKMDPFLNLIKEAAYDEDVISIKITIYRLARNAKLIDYLTTATENGKEVTVLMELRARFDEQNNIDWSETLEEAGCNVIYGFEKYKVHSKICLITRKNDSDIQYITQVGTGNYNEKTAKLYTDLSLMTSNHEIGIDASKFFNNMAIGKVDGNYETLLVAPVNMKKRILKFIDEEIAKGSEGRIILKMNSLTDRKIIDKLMEASCAGVKINMIIRGICCLVPGIKNKTENIEVHSIVGQFLEHSRVYCFGCGDNMKMYIASADYMTRNMDKRVEVGCPIYDKKIKDRILDMLYKMLNDNVKGRIIQDSGSYRKIREQDNEILKEDNIEVIDKNLNSQECFMKEAIKNAKRQLENEEKVKREKKSSNENALIDNLQEKEIELNQRKDQELNEIKKEKEDLLRIKKEIDESVCKVQNAIEQLVNLQNDILKNNKIISDNNQEPIRV